MEVLLAILIWLNLLGEVRPVKPIFDLANNMRLVNHFYFAIMVNLEQTAVWPDRAKFHPLGKTISLGRIFIYFCILQIFQLFGPKKFKPPGHSDKMGD